MTKQMLIYRNATPVSSDTHRDVSVRVGQDYRFSGEVNSVPLVMSEFATAALEYAIVFAGNDDAILPVAIFGARDGENVFVGEDGGWMGDYVPAFLRRYPFIFANMPNSDLALCIDEDCEGVNRDGRGERLFDAEGSRTQYLENVLRFLRQYQAEFDATGRVCARLRERGLLESAQATFRTTDGGSSELQGFMTINRAKLKALPGETLAEMAASDELELCYLHLFSLNRLRSVANRTASRPAEAAAETGAEENA